MKSRKEGGSVELVVLGLLAAMICLLAFPLLSAIFEGGNREDIAVKHANNQLRTIAVTSQAR